MGHGNRCAADIRHLGRNDRNGSIASRRERLLTGTSGLWVCPSSLPFGDRPLTAKTCCPRLPTGRQLLAEAGPSYLRAQHHRADLRGYALSVQFRVGSQRVRAVVSRPEAVLRVVSNGDCFRLSTVAQLKDSNDCKCLKQSLERNFLVGPLQT